MILNSKLRRGRGGERGYILLMLMLIIALMAMAALAIVPSIKFNLKRDREEEMIHRGVQYSRAIRAYYKKFGRYPTKIEDLESANNLRFLRKRYKDPITGKDFKLLHFGEAKLSMGGGLGGGVIPGANGIGANGLNGPTGVGGLSQTSSFGGNSGFGANSNSSFGQNQLSQNQLGQNQLGQNQNPQTSGGQAPEPDLTQPAGQPSPDGTGANPAGPGNGNGNGNAAPGDKLSGQVFGGGAIVGVASTSKDPTIREFNHKKKYNEWQFVYDPTTDRGGIIKTPYQPQLEGFGLQQNGQGLQGLNPQGLNPQNGNGQTGAGNGFGATPYGMQNNPNQPSPGGFGNSNQPPNSQQQPQQPPPNPPE